jgi:hypothetical protein
MRLSIAAIYVMTLGFAGASAAFAQSPPTALSPGNPALPGDSDNNTIAVPPAPAIVAAPPSIQPIPVPAMPAPPGLVPATPPADIDTGDNTPPAAQAPPADNSAAQGQPAPAAPTPAAPVPDIAPIPPNSWVPAQTAKIGVLDKVDGSVSELSIPVGGQSVVGDLQVNIRACMIRPPDQVPDAAVFLALQSTQNPSAPPDYSGWLVRSAPGAAVAGDASETFRVIGCS